MPDMAGVAVDAAHSLKSGRTEIQGIDLSTGKLLFYRDAGNLTVNIGEFLALTEGIRQVLEKGVTPPVVWSDSLTAIRWVRDKATASRKRSRLCQKAEIYLKACAALVDTVEIRHWDSKVLGENPADFGNKKYYFFQ